MTADQAKEDCEAAADALTELLLRRHDAKEGGATDEELAGLDAGIEAAWRETCKARDRLALAF